MLEAFKNNPAFIKRKVKKAAVEAGGAAEENKIEEVTYEWIQNFDKITIPAAVSTASSKATGKASDD